MYDPALMFTIPRLAIVRYVVLCLLADKLFQYSRLFSVCALWNVLAVNICLDQHNFALCITRLQLG